LLEEEYRLWFRRGRGPSGGLLKTANGRLCIGPLGDQLLPLTAVSIDDTVALPTLLKGPTMRMHNPPHPGSIIKDAIAAIPMSVTAFAAHIGVSRVALSRVLNRRAGVTPEMSIKISEAFGQDSPDIWFNLQNDYDFWQASKTRTGRKKIEPLHSAAA
jgi:addiction module HigA family antidote